MGNDGGSIPKRRELVKEAAQKPTTSQIKETQQEQQEYHWKNCPLSHQPLQPPIVSDSSGKLYNKDAILEFLLPAGDGTPGMSKSDNEEVLEGRVRSLRDVVEVMFQAEEVQDTKGGSESPRELKWVCPITNKALGPGVKAVYIVPCGHAFSESAVKEMAGEHCLQCNEPYTPENIILILPTASSDKDRLLARSQMLKAQGLTHSLKKASGSGKKRKKNGEATTGEVALKDTSTDRAAFHDITPQLASKGASKQRSQGIKNAATASLTAKVLAEEQEKSKRRKLESNQNLKSLFSSGNKRQKDGDFMTRGFSIPTGAKYN